MCIYMYVHVHVHQSACIWVVLCIDKQDLCIIDVCVCVRSRVLHTVAE